MTLTTDKKKKIIKKHATQKGDTGSPEVQIALLSERIQLLIDHLKTHLKDNHSRRGLLAMVSKRRRLLNYLKTKSPSRHQTVAKALSLAK